MAQGPGRRAPHSAAVVFTCLVVPYSLTWEPAGVYRRYFGDVTIDERTASFDAICGDPRFDALRYTITDDLDVTSYEVTDEATAEIAARHIGPLITNASICMAAVATRPARRIDTVSAGRSCEPPRRRSAGHTHQEALDGEAVCDLPATEG